MRLIVALKDRIDSRNLTVCTFSIFKERLVYGSALIGLLSLPLTVALRPQMDVKKSASICSAEFSTGCAQRLIRRSAHLPTIGIRVIAVKRRFDIFYRHLVRSGPDGTTIRGCTFSGE
jgi:hypothetical protein